MAATSLHLIAPTRLRYQNVRNDIPATMVPSNPLQVKKRKSFSLGYSSRDGGWVPSPTSHFVGLDPTP